VELGEIHRKLELARRIQLSLLPGALSESADIRIVARYVPVTPVPAISMTSLSPATGRGGC